MIIHVAKPGLFVTALFCFMTSWDEYMYASIFINTTLKKTIQVGMQDFVGQYSVDWGLLMSAVVISLIPILIFFALVQKKSGTGTFGRCSEKDKIQVRCRKRKFAYEFQT